jgi:hypothetical protein
MRFSGKRRKRGSDLLKISTDVGGGGARVGLAVVPCVGTRHRLPEVAFYPRQRGVPKPMRADLLRRDPRKMLSQTQHK